MRAGLASSLARRPSWACSHPGAWQKQHDRGPYPASFSARVRSWQHPRPWRQFLGCRRWGLNAQTTFAFGCLSIRRHLQQLQSPDEQIAAVMLVADSCAEGETPSSWGMGAAKLPMLDLDTVINNHREG